MKRKRKPSHLWQSIVFVLSAIMNDIDGGGER